MAVNRYARPAIAETEWEPGSHGRVLKNLLGIRTETEMNVAVMGGLRDAEEQAVRLYGPDHPFTASDVCNLHRLIFEGIFAWAGEYRNVHISIPDLMFASPEFIHPLMREYEDRFLAPNTPLKPGPIEESALALAIIHAELIIIHPFRDGNGRTARLLTMLLAYQSGNNEINFYSIANHGELRQEYFKAIQESWSKNYGLLQKVFLHLLESADG